MQTETDFTDLHPLRTCYILLYIYVVCSHVSFSVCECNLEKKTLLREGYQCNDVFNIKYSFKLCIILGTSPILGL